MRYEWDLAKGRRNQWERGFGFDVAILIFEGDTIEWLDDRWDYGETRVRAIGKVDDLVLRVVFTGRADVRRIISARIANRKERDRWHAGR